MLADLEQHGYLNLRVVARGVDTRLFHPDRRSAVLRQQWGVKPQQPVALYVGRLAPEKNLPVVLQAYAAMKAARPDTRLVLVGLRLGATLALRAFYHRTTIGLSMMAASIDADGAATTGINVGRMRTFTFVLGGLLGALGGILVTPLIGVDYQLGLNLTLKGFAAAVLGGLTNPLGAAVGGLTLGLVESLAIIGISSSYKDVVAFSVLIVIMILMPQGILGRAGRRGG